MLPSTKLGSRYRYDKGLTVLVQKHLYLLVAFYLYTLAGAALAQTVGGEDVKSACCRHEAAEIAQLHKSADRLYGQFKAKEAMAELVKILKSDSKNFEALVKLARVHIDIGDSLPESGANWQERKLKQYMLAQDFARRALQVDPNSTWSHFWIAAAVGSVAVVSPRAKQVELAAEIRDAVEKSIALDPKNGSAYHVYGVWHRKVAEIGGASRIFATVLFGKSLPNGSVDKSIEYLQKAMALNPTVIVSRLELARSHVARGDFAEARTLLKTIPEMAIQFSDDAKHKQKAAQLLDEIKDR
jgi:tetratricopeptide (TPR) repeat protein